MRWAWVAVGKARGGLLRTCLQVLAHNLGDIGAGSLGQRLLSVHDGEKALRGHVHDLRGRWGVSPGGWRRRTRGGAGMRRGVVVDLSMQPRADADSRCNLLPLLVPAHTHTGGIPHTLTYMSSTLFHTVSFTNPFTP